MPVQQAAGILDRRPCDGAFAQGNSQMRCTRAFFRCPSMDLDVYCSVEIPGKQYPELMSEVVASLSIVEKAVFAGTFVGMFLLSLVSCLCKLRESLTRRCPCFRKRSEVREDEMNAV